MDNNDSEKTEQPEVHEKKRRNSIELQKVEVQSTIASSPPVPLHMRNSAEKYEKELNEKSSYPRPEVVYRPESTSSWMTCLKYSLLVFNFLIWILGAGILGVAIWIKVNPDFWSLQLNLEMKQFGTAAIVAIIVGLVILVISFIGCFGATRESSCLLIVYFIILLIVVFMEMAAMGIVWSAMSNADTKEHLQQHIKSAIDKLKDEDGDTYLYFLDLLQAKLECCGIIGVKDYIDTQPPRSCTDDSTGLPFEKGCVDTVFAYFKSKAGMLGGIAASTLLLQFAAIGITVCLFCAIRQANKHVF